MVLLPFSVRPRDRAPRRVEVRGDQPPGANGRWRKSPCRGSLGWQRASRISTAGLRPATLPQGFRVVLGRGWACRLEEPSSVHRNQKGIAWFGFHSRWPAYKACPSRRADRSPGAVPGPVGLSGVMPTGAYSAAHRYVQPHPNLNAFRLVVFYGARGWPALTGRDSRNRVRRHTSPPALCDQTASTRRLIPTFRKRTEPPNTCWHRLGESLHSLLGAVDGRKNPGRQWVHWADPEGMNRELTAAPATAFDLLSFPPRPPAAHLPRPAGIFGEPWCVTCRR